MSKKIQRANNVRKVTQKQYILLFKKVNFVHHLLHIICSCFRNHCLHMVLRDPGRNSFFFCKKVWSTWQNILLCKDVLSVVSHLFLQKYFSGRKSHAFLLLASYALFLYEWNEKMGPTHNIFLNPKDLAQTSTAIGWKKEPK